MTPPVAGRATLSRAERLRDGREIERLFRRGGRIERGSFLLLWHPAAGPRAAAFAASRRVGGSVERNRARRRLREAYRRQKEALPGHGVRVCFVARPRAAGGPFPALRDEVADALRQAARRLLS
jgi:ribonuclease P protein component